MRSNGPTKYTPSEVELTTLFCLQKAHLFLGVLATELPSGSPYVEGFVEGDGFYTGYKFLTDTGVTLNYFTTARDVTSVRTDPSAPLEECLAEYNKLMATNKIKATDITLMPLVYVNQGRKHFTTLVIYTDDKSQTQVILVEPRSNNLTLRNKVIPYRYPVSNIENIVKAKLGQNIIFSNRCIGQQGLTNDEDCGAYQINYALRIAKMSQIELQNAQLFKQCLLAVSLSERRQDHVNIQAGRAWRQDPTNRKPVDTSQAQLASAVEQKTERIDRPQDGDELEMVRAPAANSAPQLPPQPTDKLHAAIQLLADYEKQSTTRPFLMFSYHRTRDQTCQGMLKLLNLMKDKVSPATAELQAAQFLYQAYISNNATNSRLRDQIEKALTKLLDASDDMKNIRRFARSNLDRRGVAAKIFLNRITALAKNADVQPLTQQAMTDIYKSMRSINEKDGSLKFKLFTSSRKKINKKRARTFDAVRERLKL